MESDNMGGSQLITTLLLSPDLLNNNVSLKPRTATSFSDAANL